MKNLDINRIGLWLECYLPVRSSEEDLKNLGLNGILTGLDLYHQCSLLSSQGHCSVTRIKLCLISFLFVGILDE